MTLESGSIEGKCPIHFLNTLLGGSISVTLLISNHLTGRTEGITSTANFDAMQYIF